MYSTVQKTPGKIGERGWGAYAPRFVDGSRSLTLPARLRLGSQAVNVLAAGGSGETALAANDSGRRAPFSERGELFRAGYARVP